MVPIHLNNLNLCPTMRCNLKCKLCGVLVPQYDYRPHMTLTEFSDTLSAIFEIVDNVGKMQITGGEPLLHSELPQMISKCFEYSDKFDELWLFTNCSIPMNADLIDILRKHKQKVVVHCSDYGVKPETAEQIVAVLQEYEIKHKYLKYYGDEQYFDGWVDQGDFVKHNRTENELKQIFSSCAHVKRGGSWYVRGGQMHWCGRSIRGCELGKIPLNSEDYVDIFDESIEKQREKLLRFFQSDFITACDYCNGLYGTENLSERKPAGEQIV